jgi:hypothetical protein
MPCRHRFIDAEVVDERPAGSANGCKDVFVEPVAVQV